LDERPSWLPVDQAAEVIEELVFSAETGDSAWDNADLVYHIVNPCTFDFEKEFLPMLLAHPSMPRLEVVDPRTWLDRLRDSDADIKRNPSRKLIDFWQGKYGKGVKKDGKECPDIQEETSEDEASKDLTFETTRTISDSSVLAKARDPVSDGLMHKIVDVWMSKWNKELEDLAKEAS
jgi:hypothetical protein